MRPSKFVMMCRIFFQNILPNLDKSVFGNNFPTAQLINLAMTCVHLSVSVLPYLGP